MPKEESLPVNETQMIAVRVQAVEGALPPRPYFD